MIYGVVKVKSVKIIFTLKQFCFSFPDQTAVCSAFEMWSYSYQRDVALPYQKHDSNKDT